MHLAPFVQDLAIILAAAALVAVVFQKIRIPVVLGYLLAGFLVGPHTTLIPTVRDLPSIQTWAEIGVIILMFSLGLEFSFRRLMRLGLPVVLTGLFQVFGMMYLGFGAGKLLGWSDTTSLFIGAIISISSTTIIAKSFEELKVKHKGYVEFVFGILILEDLMAILFMVILATPRPEDGISAALVFGTLAKMIVVVGAWFIFGYYFLPRVLRQVSKVGNDETIIIFTLGLCFVLALVASEYQFSSSLGAFIMGSILSESTESHRIEKLIKPIRDLFLAIFFVSVGMLINPESLIDFWPTVIFFTIILILGNIFFVASGALLTGQKMRDAVRSGFSLGNIGEFSFILATLGIQKGSIGTEILAITVSISALTTLLTPGLILLGQKSVDKLDKKIPEKWQRALSDYQSWWHRNLGGKRGSHLYWQALVSWGVNGFVILSIFALSSEFLLPYVRKNWDTQFSGLLCWGAAFIASLPFIWGMFWSFRRIRSPITNDKTLMILKYSSRVGLLILVGTVSGAFFEAKLAVVVILATTLATIIVLYRRLESAYSDFEHKFVSNFKEKDARPFSGTFPWDAHLSKVVIPHESPVSGQTLADANIRKHTGVSIVNIRRGNRDFVAPLGSFRVFPEDELLVLGTDEQIQKLALFLAPSTKIIAHGGSRDFRIVAVAILPEHPFSGKKISELKLHDSYASILVGIERGVSQIMSPPADFVVQPGDFVWLVGPVDKLDQIGF